MNLMHETDANGQFAHSTTLVDAILSYSRQACSEPLDIVFGLLGLTNSQLQPNYSMSRSELFLRVLIESVVDRDRLSQLKAIKKQRDKQGPFRKVAVAVLLLYHLQLDIYDPVVTLTMNIALTSCHNRLKYPQVSTSEISHLLLHLSLRNMHYLRSLLKIPWLTENTLIRLEKCLHWLRSMATALRLRVTKWRGDTLTSPYNPADTITHEAWADMAINLVTEIAGNGEAILERQYQKKEADYEVQVLRPRTLATELKAEAADDVLRVIDDRLREVNDVRAGLSESLIDKGVLYLWSVEFYAEMIEKVREIEAWMARNSNAMA
jgi:hypothetical protein